jgi:tetratricopeptide (TPR) repeat protein
VPWSGRQAELQRALSRGWALLAAGSHAGAEAAFRDALRAHAENRDARLGLSTALSGKGDHAEALDLLKGLRAEDADDPSIHRRLVYAFLALKRTGGALVAAEQAVALDPDSAQSHAAHGVALYAVGDRAEAEAALRRAVELDAADEHALAFLAQVLIERGALADAAPVVAAAAAIAPAYPQVLHAQGQLAWAEGRAEAARDFALWGLADDPEHEGLRRLLVRTEARRRPWAAHAFWVHDRIERLGAMAQLLTLYGVAALTLLLPLYGWRLFTPAGGAVLSVVWLLYILYVSWLAPSRVRNRLQREARKVRLRRGF